MPQTREQKAKILDQLVEKFTKAKSIIFSDYRGLHVKDIEKLRRNLRKDDIDYTVSKKTLMNLAAQKAGLPEIPNDIFSGPCGAAFSYKDEVAPARIIKDFAKENENLKLLGGIMEGRVLSLSETKELSMLPPYEQLVAKFVGCLQGPIYGLYGTLHGVMRKFVGTVQALHDEKSKS